MSEPKPSDRSSPAPRRSKRQVVPGKHAQADGLQLRSYDVGALPLLKRIAERMQLQRILSEHLPRDDSRTELPTVTALLVLFANLLMAREPVYGVGEWAALFPPDLLGLREQDLSRLHDDRLGRSLDRMFEGIGPALIMAVVRHVIQTFAISLDELHNDSTTVSFYGAYDAAGEELEESVAGKAEAEAVGDGPGERDGGDGEEGGDADLWVVPLDGAEAGKHEATDEDERGSGGEAGDGSD